MMAPLLLIGAANFPREHPSIYRTPLPCGALAGRDSAGVRPMAAPFGADGALWSSVPRDRPLGERILFQKRSSGTGTRNFGGAFGGSGGAMERGKNIQPEFTTLLEQPRRIVNALSAKGWTPLLRVVIQSLTGDIQLRDISVRQMADGEGAHLMRLEGIAMGRSPRIVADQFRSALERGLEGEHSGPVKTQFERLEDAEVPTIGSAPAQADFTITISLGPEPLTGDGGGGT